MQAARSPLAALPGLNQTPLLIACTSVGNRVAVRRVLHLTVSDLERTSALVGASQVARAQSG